MMQWNVFATLWGTWIYLNTACVHVYNILATRWSHEDRSSVHKPEDTATDTNQ